MAKKKRVGKWVRAAPDSEGYWFHLHAHGKPIPIKTRVWRIRGKLHLRWCGHDLPIEKHPFLDRWVWLKLPRWRGSPVRCATLAELSAEE